VLCWLVFRKLCKIAGVPIEIAIGTPAIGSKIAGVPIAIYGDSAPAGFDRAPAGFRRAFVVHRSESDESDDERYEGGVYRLVPGSVASDDENQQDMQDDHPVQEDDDEECGQGELCRIKMKDDDEECDQEVVAGSDAVADIEEAVHDPYDAGSDAVAHIADAVAEAAHDPYEDLPAGASLHNQNELWYNSIGGLLGIC